ncbi:hypothetical protein OCU04_004332 [Sclerotinia nivalis]|uniref:Uncharacterized protein n=1 Tax=Sclerotinia nivalis TaxID=352851 RepID=A0A9X0AQ83_9HELO|nr:hypothetical protein OCU04_004332 [Sclerotinia nivalis]
MSPLKPNLNPLRNVKNVDIEPSFHFLEGFFFSFQLPCPSASARTFDTFWKCQSVLINVIDVLRNQNTQTIMMPKGDDLSKIKTANHVMLLPLFASSPILMISCLSIIFIVIIMLSIIPTIVLKDLCRINRGKV